MTPDDAETLADTTDPDSATTVAGRAQPRDIVAAFLLCIPFLVVATTGLLWYRSLPAELPAQWNENGVSSTTQLWATFAATALATLTAAVVATVALSTNGATTRRQVFLGTGLVAGVAAAVWLGTTIPVLTAGSGEPEMGAWPLVAILLCGYGLLPFLLAHPWSDEQFDYGTVPIDGTTDSGEYGAETELETSHMPPLEFTSAARAEQPELMKPKLLRPKE